MPSRVGISFQSDKSIAEYRELARIVDRYDFATVSVYQDLFYQPPWPALLQFAELTSTPLVGPAVLNPYLCHPVLAAGHLALIDEVSRGRCSFPFFHYIEHFLRGSTAAGAPGPDCDEQSDRRDQANCQLSPGRIDAEAMVPGEARDQRFHSGGARLLS